MYMSNNVKNIATVQGGASLIEAEKTQLIELSTGILVKYTSDTTRIFLVIKSTKYREF